MNNEIISSNASQRLYNSLSGSFAASTPQVIIQMTPEQLKTFAFDVIAEYTEQVLSKNKEEQDNRLLTTKETCEFLEISETTLWRLETKAHMFKAVGTGKSKRFRYKDIAAYKYGQS